MDANILLLPLAVFAYLALVAGFAWCLKQVFPEGRIKRLLFTPFISGRRADGGRR